MVDVTIIDCYGKINRMWLLIGVQWYDECFINTGLFVDGWHDPVAFGGLGDESIYKSWRWVYNGFIPVPFHKHFHWLNLVAGWEKNGCPSVTVGEEMSSEELREISRATEQLWLGCDPVVSEYFRLVLNYQHHSSWLPAGKDQTFTR